tara:strand:+ start:5765 stop:6439 length:675 start_codon:yes stop_codon:yes gene_type:complete
MKPRLKYKRSPSSTNSSPLFKGLLLLYAICTTIAIFLLVGSIETITQDNQIQGKSGEVLANKNTNLSTTSSRKTTTNTAITPRISHLHLFQAHSQAPFIIRTVALMNSNLLDMGQELKLINDIVRKTKIPSRMANPPFIPVRSIFRKQDALIVDFHPDMLTLVDGKTVSHIQNTYVLVHSLLEFSQMRKVIFLFDGGRAAPSQSNINFKQGLIANPHIVKGTGV